MRILGMSGGFDPVCFSEGRDDWRLLDSPVHFHDAAAVLMCDGKLVAGIEEERLNRLKHTNKFPASAIKCCLEIGDLKPEQIDRFAFYGLEERLDLFASSFVLNYPDYRGAWSGRSLLAQALTRTLNHEVDPARITFVDHHLAHAVSAFIASAFADALVVTVDGQGDTLSGTVYEGRGRRLRRLVEVPVSKSLGIFYVKVLGFLGYGLFDEYKVMGLAPYGDPGRYRELLDQLCVLEQGGTYSVYLERLRILRKIGAPRRSGEDFTQAHKDLAAALQEKLEAALMHQLTHYRRETGLTRLCLAGGVAHNSSANGTILRSGLFEEVFVQPASHDAGCALGAALHTHSVLCPDVPLGLPNHVYWGADVGSDEAIRSQVERWQGLVEVRILDDAAGEAAQLLAEGAVLGWVQGRSEFGPRALGNRSIIADPRPASNKDRINALVKKREAYRPFAPAILAECADEFFEVAKGQQLDFMTFVVPVREAYRKLLGAVTHVDGTARVQTVSRETNPRFWHLIRAFGDRSSVPIVLNTSFNNHFEPIVDSVEDALVCLLTTGLSHLVVGGVFIEKAKDFRRVVPDLAPSLPEHIRLSQSRQKGRAGWMDLYLAESSAGSRVKFPLSKRLYEILLEADGETSLSKLWAGSPIGEHERLLAELEALWERRAIRMRPSST